MKLPIFEVFLSLFMYIAALIYAIYHAFQYGQSEFVFELRKTQIVLS